VDSEPAGALPNTDGSAPEPWHGPLHQTRRKSKNEQAVRGAISASNQGLGSLI
jgi:hypothetical protein